MSALELYQTEITAHDGTPVRLIYDQEADIRLSHFQASPTERIPFAYLEAQPAMITA